MRYILFLALIFILSLAQAQSKIKVACVGNSITEGANIEAGKRYPDVLQNLLGSGYEVRNFGLGGRTLLKKGDFPYWNEKLYADVLEWKPDVVIIKLGTNDSKPQNWKYKDEFVSDYQALVQSFKALSSTPKIYLCLPVPVYKTAWGITEEIVKGEVLPLVKQVAKKEKVKVIDLYKTLSGHAEMLPDGVHPDAAGAALMAEAIYKKIK
jgi:acyl-CoA thioesterase-1